MADTPQVFYNGNNITCYPSSNATDNGKLNLEFNMARLVTRLSSKNFCITNPSFTLTSHADPLTGDKTIKVGPGQASINGMDLIMTEEIYIEPPLDTNTEYYLAFHLHRDPTNNVRGDLTVGVDVTFEGLSLSYYTDKGENDKDRLNLGKVIWDGTDFTELVEDEDKYGRIWAEDILCKLSDPKHPDDTRMLLQEWMYNVPDWYFSKEGDTIYGPLQIVDNRTSNNPGILMNVEGDTSKVIIKNPTEDNSLLQFYGDLDRDGSITQDDLDLVNGYIAGTQELTNLQLILADVNGDGVVDEKDAQYIADFIAQTEGVSYGKTGQIYFIDNTTHGITYTATDGETTIQLAQGQITSNSDNNWDLEINSAHNIRQHSSKHIYIQGDQGVHIGSGGNGDQPELLIQDHGMTLTDTRGTTNNLTYSVEFVDNTTVQQKLGKAIWKYDSSNQYVSLLSTNVSRMSITPVSEFIGNVYARGSILVRGTDASTTDTTNITKDSIQIVDGTNTSELTSSTFNIITDNNTDGSILIKKSDNNGSTKIYDTGKIDLIDKTNGTPQLYFSQGVTASDVTLSKVNGQNKLNLVGGLTVSQSITATGEITGSGLTAGNGILTFVNGNNNATINKSNGSSLLYTSGAFNVGQTGNQALKAGTGTFSGNVAVGAGVTITTGGDITATNTISGNKVLGAVYQDIAETYESDGVETFEDGDLLFINNEGKVSKPQTMEDCKKIIGIYSEDPFIILGEKLYTDKTRCSVGIVGKLYAKTNQEFLTYGDKVKATPNGVEKVKDLLADLAYIVGTVVEPYKDGKVRINFNKVV